MFSSWSNLFLIGNINSTSGQLTYNQPAMCSPSQGAAILSEPLSKILDSVLVGFVEGFFEIAFATQK